MFLEEQNKEKDVRLCATPQLKAIGHGWFWTKPIIQPTQLLAGVWQNNYLKPEYKFFYNPSSNSDKIFDNSLIDIFYRYTDIKQDIAEELDNLREDGAGLEDVRERKEIVRIR